jgi:hypothetical protein
MRPKGVINPKKIKHERLNSQGKTNQEQTQALFVRDKACYWEIHQR